MDWHEHPVIHVFGQDSFHDEVYVAANRAGLEALRDAIGRALEHKTGQAEAFVSDGEGYVVHVIEMTPHEVDSIITPYTADYAVDGRKDALKPWEMVKHG